MVVVVVVVALFVFDSGVVTHVLCPRDAVLWLMCALTLMTSTLQTPIITVGVAGRTRIGCGTDKRYSEDVIHVLYRGSNPPSLPQETCRFLRLVDGIEPCLVHVTPRGD